MDAVELIRKRVAWCEAEGVEILCCPEAVLGGLADYAAHPADIAIDVESGQLDAVLTPLASDTVTTILGFTERAGTGELYNSAAVFHRGSVIGVYRKLHPAIRKSIYRAGERIPVFHVGGLTFGIVICNDSNHAEPARIMASQGAAVLFVPTNNGLPPAKADCRRRREERGHRPRGGEQRVGHPCRCRRPHRGSGVLRIVRCRRSRGHGPSIGAAIDRGSPGRRSRHCAA